MKKQTSWRNIFLMAILTKIFVGEDEHFVRGGGGVKHHFDFDIGKHVIWGSPLPTYWTTILLQLITMHARIPFIEFNTLSHLKPSLIAKHKSFLPLLRTAYWFPLRGRVTPLCETPDELFLSIFKIQLNLEIILGFMQTETVKSSNLRKFRYFEVLIRNKKNNNARLP